MLNVPTRTDLETQVETVLFTMYYPTAKGAISTKPGHLWIPRPLGVVGSGYARFAHVSNFVTDSIFTFALWLMVGRTRIPAQVDVPLHGTPLEVQTADPMTLSSSGSFPVMVFSHGYASSRTQYTQYLGQLASRGYVVAAVEHRDGSGPGSVIMKKGVEDVDRLTFSLSHLMQDWTPQDYGDTC